MPNGHTRQPDGGDMAQVLHRSTSDFATAAIRQMILTGELKPGDRVDQNEIATRLDISRHPVRQAIERLAERGFVQSRPHRSVIVSDLSIADMEQLYFARKVLEEEAIRLSWDRYDAAFLDGAGKLIEAMDRATRNADLDEFMFHNLEFHMNFYRACGNVHIVRVISSLFELSERYQRTALMTNPRRDVVGTEHSDMLKAIDDRDLEGFLVLCDRHNEGTKKAVRNSLRSQG